MKKKLFYEATIKEILENQSFFDDFTNLVRYLNPKNVYEVPELMTFAWGKIKEWQRLFNTKQFDSEDLVRLFTEFTGKKQEEIEKLLAINFFYQIKWILGELEKLSLKEISNLSVQLTPEEIEAGFEDMNKFGYKATTDALALGNVLKWDEIEAEPYHKIFTKLLIQKTKAEIDKKYSKILYKK